MYMENGFIFIPRKFLDGSIWQEKKAYSQSAALIDLHVMARFAAEPAEVVVARRRVRVEHGQVVASLRYLARRWRWSVGRVRRFVTLLRDEGWIAVDTADGILRITVPDIVGGKVDAACSQQVEAAEGVPGSVRQCVLPASRRHTAGDTSGTAGGTKKKKGREEKKETSLTGGKERLSPPLSRTGGGVLIEEDMGSGDAGACGAEPSFRFSGSARRQAACGPREGGGARPCAAEPVAAGQQPGWEQKSTWWEHTGPDCEFLHPLRERTVAKPEAGRWLRLAEVAPALLADGRWLERVRMRANRTAVRPIAAGEMAEVGKAFRPQA